MKLATRNRILRSAAPLGLVAVAAWQVLGVVFLDLTPWKGGGFGMFSSVDNPGMRTVRCYVAFEDNSGEIVETLTPIQGLSFDIDQSIRLERMRPSQSGLDKLARKLASLSFVLAPKAGNEDGVLELKAKAGRPEPNEHEIRIRHLRVELSKSSVDPEMRISSTTLFSAAVKRRPLAGGQRIAQAKTP